MVWVRFPYGVMYKGERYAAGEDIPVSDDNLAQFEAKGAKIVRAVYEPEPEESEKEVAVRTRKSAQAASPQKRKGRKPKSA